MDRRQLLKALVAASIISVPGYLLAQDSRPARITIIYDAFGKPSDLGRGWGYAALIEYGGKRILFDTGGQYKVFAENVKKLKINLKNLDFVVLSHRHGDHTSGLQYVIEQNPKVQFYAPTEAGSFGNPISGASPLGKLISRKVDDVPGDLHYFDGKYEDKYKVDSAWPTANITLIDKPTAVIPGFILFKTVSENKGTMELNELSLAIKTPQGLALIVGCSHPGIEKILAAATEIDPKIYTLAGGLHLVDVNDQQITQIVSNFKNKWGIERIAAGHCSGEFAQVEFSRSYGDKHDHSGVGEIILLPK